MSTYEASVYFAGSSTDYANVTTSPAFDFGTGDFTVEAWIRLGINDTAYRNVFTITYGSGQLLQMRFGDSGFGNQFQFCADGASTSTCFLTTYTRPGVWVNTWNHVAMSRQAGIFRCFINGQLVPTTLLSASSPLLERTVTFNYSNATTVRIGQQWLGDISNVRVTKGSALYTSTFVPQTSSFASSPDTSLLTCQTYPLDDASSNNLEVTLVGNSSYSFFTPFSNQYLGPSGDIAVTEVTFPISNMPEIANIGILSSSGLDELSSSVSNLPTPSIFGERAVMLSSHPLPGFLTPLGSGTHEIVGYVKDAQNNPLARRVFAISRSSLLPLDSTLSDPISGSFRLQVPNEECVVVCLPLESDNVNAEIFDRINPIDI